MCEVEPNPDSVYLGFCDYRQAWTVGDNYDRPGTPLYIYKGDEWEKIRIYVDVPAVTMTQAQVVAYVGG
jgi:hypothetical protein